MTFDPSTLPSVKDNKKKFKVSEDLVAQLKSEHNVEEEMMKKVFVTQAELDT